jgi:hypothetical protein
MIAPPSKAHIEHMGASHVFNGPPGNSLVITSIQDEAAARVERLLMG